MISSLRVVPLASPPLPPAPAPPPATQCKQCSRGMLDSLTSTAVHSVQPGRAVLQQPPPPPPSHPLPFWSPFTPLSLFSRCLASLPLLLFLLLLFFLDPFPSLSLITPTTAVSSFSFHLCLPFLPFFIFFLSSPSTCVFTPQSCGESPLSIFSFLYVCFMSLTGSELKTCR